VTGQRDLGREQGTRRPERLEQARGADRARRRQRITAQPMAFEAVSGGRPVRLIPVSRAAHEYYSVYWQTE
jgi:hypothetical protein